MHWTMKTVKFLILIMLKLYFMYELIKYTKINFMFIFQ